MEEAVSIDPFRFMGLGVAGHTHARVGDKERAVRLLKRAIEVVPSNPVGPNMLADTYDRLGQEALALEALIGMGFPPETEGAIRRAYGERGMTGAWSVFLELSRVRSGLECKYQPLTGVIFLTRVERNEESLRCIKESTEQRTLGLESYLKVDPLFDPIRRDPRFQTALEKMGLVD